MAIQIRLVQAAISLIGPAVVPALRRAAADPRTREQVSSILGQIRTGVGESTPTGRAQARLRRDLEATIALTEARRDTARDDGEQALAEGWVREAQDIRNAAEIAGALGPGGRRDLIAGLDGRRLALLRRMLHATLPDFGTDEPAEDLVDPDIIDIQVVEPAESAEPAASPEPKASPEPFAASDSPLPGHPDDR